jgi:hypothetical protein
MENKIKHLEFIQKTINRMAGNLFFLRCWTITLITGLFALSAKEISQNYILIAYFLILIFWILDGYFLSQERLFRALYNHVILVQIRNAIKNKTGSCSSSRRRDDLELQS